MTSMNPRSGVTKTSITIDVNLFGSQKNINGTQRSMSLHRLQGLLCLEGTNPWHIGSTKYGTYLDQNTKASKMPRLWWNIELIGYIELIWKRDQFCRVCFLEFEKALAFQPCFPHDRPVSKRSPSAGCPGRFKPLRGTEWFQPALNWRLNQ